VFLAELTANKRRSVIGYSHTKQSKSNRQNLTMSYA